MMPADKMNTALNLPDWVPESAKHYIAHTETGAPIRALARAAGCHASTVMRQIRKIELQRDDPLVDAALRKLSAGDAVRKQDSLKRRGKNALKAEAGEGAQDIVIDEANLVQRAPYVLRRLCEPSAVLAVAAEMEKAVVVRDTAEGGTARTAIVDTALAQAMALKDWIAASKAGRIVRYQITAAGRAALSEMVADLPQAQAAMLDQRACENGDYIAPANGWHEKTEIIVDTPRRQRMRYALSESPLTALARRKDIDGEPFLSDALVHAGERLREDFELAQMDTAARQNRDQHGTAKLDASRCPKGEGVTASADARARVAGAMTHLGPGLSDVVLRCCCYLEGLETTEKRLGWSARSGKIVLRIALHRLKRHYDETIGAGGAMIG